MLLQSTRRSWYFAGPNVSMTSRITTLTAVVVLNTAGVGPELMAVLEGESLFNDASSITLFEVQSAEASQPCCSGPAADPRGCGPSGQCSMALQQTKG